MNTKYIKIIISSFLSNIILLLLLIMLLISSNNSDRKIIKEWTSDIVTVEVHCNKNASYTLTQAERQTLFAFLNSASEFKNVSYDSPAEFGGTRANFHLTKSNGVKIILLITDSTISENLGYDYSCDAETLDRLVSLYNEVCSTGENSIF